MSIELAAMQEALAGIVSAELGASRTVSLPRSSRTRPLLPVRTESPGLSCAWSVASSLNSTILAWSIIFLKQVAILSWQ